MKVTISKPIEVDIKYLQVSAGVRYWEDAVVNGEEDADGLIPCRQGDYWKPVIDIETGVIINWKQGIEADIHYKVCDDGVYCLTDEAGTAQLVKEGYVPCTMCPADRGYGDYIIMSVDKDGRIADWQFNIEDFQSE